MLNSSRSKALRWLDLFGIALRKLTGQRIPVVRISSPKSRNQLERTRQNIQEITGMFVPEHSAVVA